MRTYYRKHERDTEESLPPTTRTDGTPRLLFLEVIRLALEDYRKGKERWAYFFSKDFNIVCFRADVYPNEVRKVLRRYVRPEPEAPMPEAPFITHDLEVLRQRGHMWHG